MRRQLLILSVAMAMATPAMGAPWVRGYVVDKYELAFHYGGRGGTLDPGTDCPKGAIPDNDYRQLLTTKWRTEAEMVPLLKPAGEEATAEAALATHFALERAISHRGFRRDIETYINPFAAPDPGIQEVTGKIAEGFNLDGNAKTGGFTGLGGENGVDNAYYRAVGCASSYRGPSYQAGLSQRSIARMQDGLYTIVIRLSGNKDPMNDDDVTVEIGYSPDQVVKNGNGDVVGDYSFRVVKTAQYNKLKGKVKDGVLETEQVSHLRWWEFAWFAASAGEVDFQKGKVRLVLGKDGTISSGLVGGYRDWRELYGKDAWNQGQFEPTSATTRETYYHQNEIGLYYALKRNADATPDPKTGQNTAISIAYRFTAKPAYIVEPAIPVGIKPWTDRELAQRSVSADYRSRFLHAVTTKSITDMPVDTRRRGGGQQAPAGSGAPTPQVNKNPPATVASSAATVTER